MAPKKAAASATKKSTAAHGSYQDMIRDALIQLKDRQGSSRQAVKKYVWTNNTFTGVTDAQFTVQFNRALQKGSESGVFARPKGASGPVKLAKPTKAVTESKPAAKPAAKKATTATATKKAPAKKATAATTKTATKKAPTKKASATKSKANTSKSRKTPTSAPAVEEKAPVVLGKTKSGRVTKSKAPQPAKAGAKKATTTKKVTARKA